MRLGLSFTSFSFILTHQRYDYFTIMKCLTNIKFTLNLHWKYNHLFYSTLLFVDLRLNKNIRLPILSFELKLILIEQLISLDRS